ncbi:hypothetical protein MTO96_022075 [Rhipicephalus appendiculatus]
MWRQGGTICLWSFSVVAAVAVLFARGQKPVPHGCDLDKESKGASKCAQENFKGKFDQVMAEKLVIGCITGNLTIAEFRNRCREPPIGWPRRALRRGNASADQVHRKAVYAASCQISKLCR